MFMKQSVLIELQTKIDDDGEIEYNTVRQKGHFFTKGNLDVVMYEEEPESGQTIRNLISIQQNTVNIKRSGFITMNQKFVKGQKTESHYEHPHGSIHMETFTNNIDYVRTETSDYKLRIDYTVKLNGMDLREHTLSLAITKENNE